MKSKKDHCYYCNKHINKREDLYYLFVSISRSIAVSTKYLSFCKECFLSNTDEHLIKRLNELSNNNINTGASINETTRAWLICPFCNVSVKQLIPEFTYQLSEISKQDVNSVAIHVKCYDTNIGINQDEYYC